MIYLFSSNASPQYAQDILNVLAAPQGGLYTFRYERKRVEAELASQWDARLEDARMLVCFSLQQRGAYADPAFIPVRAGTVVAAYPVGSQLIVTFRMDEIVALQLNRGGYGKPDQVKHFTEWLKTNVHHVPYAFSASRGPSALDEVWLDNATGVREQGSIFEAAAKWLEPTETFNQARFVRFGSIRERGPNGEEARLDADGRLNLVAGRTHTLRVIHYQPSPVTDRQAFEVAVDQDVVRIIGRPGFDVASRYNETRLELHAQPIERAGAAETVLVIDAAAGVQGPRIVIPIRVTTPGTRVALAVGGPALTLGLIGLPTLAGLNEPFSWLSILGGILLAAVFQYAGLRGLGIRNPFTAAPTHAGSDGQQ